MRSEEDKLMFTVKLIIHKFLKNISNRNLQFRII